MADQPKKNQMPQMKDWEDEKLMLAYQQGEVSAFDILYERYSGRVYAYLKSRMGSRRGASDIDEVFQQALLKFHASRANYSDRYLFSQWLFVIVRTTLLDFFRKDAREKNRDEAYRAEQQPSIQHEPLGAELDLKGLSEEQAEALRLRFVEDLSYEEIAGRLTRSPASIRQMVSRTLKRLRLSRLKGGET